LNCDAVIDTGDGARLPMSWSVGDGRTKTARYEYKRAGNYRVSVAGSGKDACVGVKYATISVGTPKAEAKAGAARCPVGWTLVEDSVKGPRYTCRARTPPLPLPCTEGTNQYSERGEIGCR
jgi:hypothetical protein